MIMDALDRRDFFLRLAGRAGPAGADRNVPPVEGGAGAAAAGRRRVPIGRVADFPPGGTRILAADGLAVESLPEGLRARSIHAGGGWFAVGADGTGALHVDRGLEWPEDRVFSIMTGEACRLEDRKEGEE
jgi:hypothetical protein